MAADEPGEKILYALIYHTDVQETRGLTPALAPPLVWRQWRASPLRSTGGDARGGASHLAPMASIGATFNGRGRKGRSRASHLASMALGEDAERPYLAISSNSAGITFMIVPMETIASPKAPRRRSSSSSIQVVTK